MTLKTVYLIVILILIKFSDEIKGNDENRNNPTQNTATIIRNIISFNELIQETLQRFRYVRAFWQDLLPFDQNNIKAYHLFLKNNANRITPLPLTAQQIILNENVLRLPLELLNNYLKTVVTNYQLASRERITREISRLATVARQLVEYEKRILQRWHEIPDTMKIEIYNVQQQTSNSISSVYRPTRSRPLTNQEIIENRNAYIDSMLTLGVQYSKVLRYLESQRLQKRPAPGQVENQGQITQGSERLGQLRLGGQQQLGSGGQQQLGSGGQQQFVSGGQQQLDLGTQHQLGSVGQQQLGLGGQQQLGLGTQQQLRFRGQQQLGLGGQKRPNQEQGGSSHKRKPGGFGGYEG